MKGLLVVFWSFLCATRVEAASFYLADDYSGTGFFNKWNFYDGFDQYTNGDAVYLGMANATSEKLAYINEAGNAIVRVDNFTNVLYPNKRNTIRLESKATYGVGSVWIMDALHMPYGCSVWPSFWTHGEAWPANGEIDIVEGVNNMGYNQMALHSNPLIGPGCSKSDAEQSGINQAANCSTVAGCTVKEAKPNSYGPGFAQAGGGVFAAQFDITGVYMWFWSRADVPKSVQGSTSTSNIDLSDWGVPSASYPQSGCDIATYFKAQQLTLTTTLCGDWAGANDTYPATCTPSGLPNPCYTDNVIGPGSPKYDNAYFEIKYIRAYSSNLPNSTTTSSTSSPTTSSTDPSAPAGNNGSGTLQIAVGGFTTLVVSLAIILSQISLF